MAAESQILPMVTVIMPVRNEQKEISQSLGSVLAQDYPADRFEVLVADGMSDDSTRAIVGEITRRDPRVRLVDNQAGIMAAGFNTALTFARGEIIVLLGGHSEMAVDFVRESVTLLRQRPEAWCVGGPILHVAHSLFGKAVAVAMSHRLGVGNASHHFASYEGYAEGAPFPTLWRWVFERVGTLDERLVRNQDDEFYYRIRQAGGKVYISPRIRYTYFVRERIRQLFRQYFQYGFWRIPVMKKHQRPTTMRQVVPSLFYLTCICLIMIGLWLRQPIMALALPLLYGAALSAVGLSVVPKVGFQVAYRVPLAIGTIHAGYALGLMYGVWASFFQPRAWDTRGQMATISR
jgi:glycosyltransferase involved in cell wall biosynthesis